MAQNTDKSTTVCFKCLNFLGAKCAPSLLFDRLLRDTKRGKRSFAAAANIEREDIQSAVFQSITGPRIGRSLRCDFQCFEYVSFFCILGDVQPYEYGLTNASEQSALVSLIFYFDTYVRFQSKERLSG